MDAMKLKTFYQLLDEGYTPAQLASAVEAHGVTGWDRYGRYASFKPKSPGASEALDALAKFFAQLQKWEAQGIEQPYGPLDVVAETDESP